MNAIITQMIALLAGMILPSGYFERVVATVLRWKDKEIASAEKRHGVLAEFEIIGLELTGFLANIAVELAVGYVKYGAGQSEKPDVEKVITGKSNE